MEESNGETDQEPNKINEEDMGSQIKVLDDNDEPILIGPDSSEEDWKIYKFWKAFFNQATNKLSLLTVVHPNWLS